MEPEPIARLKAYGLSQAELARCLCVQKSTISQWVSGVRQLPRLVLDDLWELLRLVEERTRAGMDVHQAVQGWQPTVLLNPGGPTITSGLPIPMSDEHRAALERGDLEAAERIGLWDTIELLAAEKGQPLTAERLMVLRRLGIAVRVATGSLLRFSEGEGD
jgi:transcriptional regulator with XRE-family HTH domain